VVEATTIDFSCASACTAEKKVAPKSAMKASVTFRRECMCAVLEKTSDTMPLARSIECQFYFDPDARVDEPQFIRGKRCKNSATMSAFGNLADVGALHMSKWG
jgi:hypothetical protein